MPPALCQGKPLKGGVREDDVRNPTLNRKSDVRPNNNDPFSGKEDDTTLEAPRNTFEPEVTRPPKVLKPRIEQTYAPPAAVATPITAPTDMDGDPDAMPVNATTPNTPMYNPNDPDSSPEMQLAWDMWHKRVASAIFDRFNFFAKAAFKFSPPLTAKLSYMVTRDGHITNINLDQKSTNMLFNVLIVQCVKSLDGDANTLAFPENSRRMSVPKYGTFAQNWGGSPGFKYTVGDRETIAKQQQQQRPMQAMNQPQMQQQMMQQQQMQQMQQQQMMQQQMMQQQLMQQQMMQQQNPRGY